MTPAVIRDGKIKSHMLFNAGVLLPLEDEQHEFYEQALHTLAHECAHVEVTERFNAAFPVCCYKASIRTRMRITDGKSSMRVGTNMR